jgi:hypothetical protein
MFSAQEVSAADNHYSIVDSHLHKNDGYEIIMMQSSENNIADGVVGVRVDNGVHWNSHNTDWTETLESGYTIEWKETRHDANVIYLKSDRRYARLDFNEKVVKHCTVICLGRITTCEPEEKSRCKITGEITGLSTMNKFRIDARDIKGLMEGHNGENWQSAGNNQWYEFSDNGLFYWEETHRDNNSIYLKDNNGRSYYTARLDLYIAKVMLCEEGKECRLLGHITDAW